MKVTIITVCLNSEKTIEMCLNSVINQTYHNIEYIVFDGLSTDRTCEIIKSYSDHIDFFFHEKDNGLYDAMNKAISAATGEIICLLNSDDSYCSNTVICDVINHFNNNPRSDACYGNIKLVRDQNIHSIKRLWVAGEFSKNKFKFGWMIPHTCLFVKKSVYDRYGLFRTDFSTASDYEFMLRCFYVNDCNVTYINKYLVNQSVGGISQSFANRIRANSYDVLSWKIHGLKPSWYFRFLKPLFKLPQYFKAFITNPQI